MKHIIDIRFNTSVERSPRVLEIGEAFGLGLSAKEFVIYDHMELNTEPDDVIYVTGQSGSGKTLLLKQLRASYEAQGLKVAVIEDVQFEDKPLIDQVGENTNSACQLLSKAGLNDANLFIRKPQELSDGQKYRFRIAKLIESGADVWIADEFGAVLDRVTAKCVAYQIAKHARRHHKGLIVATTHDDLIHDINPNLLIDKRFANVVEITERDINDKL